MKDGQATFEVFYEEHFAAVCRSLSLALRDRELAEEAAQEGFTRAYLHWRRVAAMERPATWVYVVAVRFAFRRLGRKSVDLVPAPAEIGVAERVVETATLRDAIAALPARQRTAVVLRYLADLPLADVADAMGCALGTVKSTLHAALTHLEVHLTDTEQEVPRDARG